MGGTLRVNVRLWGRAQKKEVAQHSEGTRVGLGQGPRSSSSSDLPSACSAGSLGYHEASSALEVLGSPGQQTDG